MDALPALFPDMAFMPHGHCFYWIPALLALNVVSDGLIALAYFSIPITLFYFVVKRKSLRFGWIFLCFAIFIVACGMTHVMAIWNIWHADYWLAGGIKALTALASVPTAILLLKLVPDALKLRSPSELELLNRELASGIAEREAAEENLQRFNEQLLLEIKGRARTEKELQQTSDELEQFNRLMVGREQRMVELKREVNELAQALGKPPPYAMPAAGTD